MNKKLIDPEVFATVFSSDADAASYLLMSIFPLHKFMIEKILNFSREHLFPNKIKDESVIIYAEDSHKVVYDFDIMIANPECHRKQARIHSDFLTVTGRFYDYEHVEDYIILLSDTDLLGYNEPVTKIEWICNETRTVLPGSDHIIYINGAGCDEDSSVGILMKDLCQTNPDEIISPELRKAFVDYLQKDQSLDY